MTDYDYLERGNPDGTVFGQKTTSKIGFFGNTPVDQPAALTAGLTTLTYTTAGGSFTVTIVPTTATGEFGFSSLAEYSDGPNVI